VFPGEKPAEHALSVRAAPHTAFFPAGGNHAVVGKRTTCSRMAVPAINFRPALEATRQSYEARLADVFERQQFILADQVRSFENEFAAATGAHFAVGVGSGTDAIQLAFRASGIRGEVITSALTAPFTGIGILSAGCTVRFADIDPDTLQIDAADTVNRVRKK